MERRRSPSRVLPRSGISKSARQGRHSVSPPAKNSKAAYSSRARIPSQRGAATGPAQPVVSSPQLQQHYAFSFQITTDQKEDRMSQASVEKAICTSCKTLSAGQTVMGGFICEECIRIF